MSDLANKNRKIGEIIKKEREKITVPYITKAGKERMKKCSQQDLADMLGVSRELVCQWENGQGIHDFYHIQKMAEIFDCEYAYILADQEDKHKTETDIKAVTGLSADTIQALAQLKGNITGSRKGKISEQKMEIINSLLLAMLSENDNNILDNALSLISTLTEIQDIKKSDVYKMSDSELLQYQLDHPDDYEKYNGFLDRLRDDIDRENRLMYILPVEILNELRKIELK